MELLVEWVKIACLAAIGVGVWALAGELGNMSGILLDWMDEEKETESWE